MKKDIFKRIQKGWKLRGKFRKLGIKIYGMYWLPIDEWNIIYQTINELFIKYPEANSGSIKWIRVEPKRYFVSAGLPNSDLAAAGFHRNRFLSQIVNAYEEIGIVINKDEFRNIEVYERILDKKVTHNIFIRFIITHEFGHLIDLIISGYKKESRRYVDADLLSGKYGRQVSEKIVNSSVRKCYGTLDIQDEILEKEIGSDVENNNGEIFAESVALEYCGLGTTLSNMIIREYYQYLKDS